MTLKQIFIDNGIPHAYARDDGSYSLPLGVTQEHRRLAKSLVFEFMNPVEYAAQVLRDQTIANGEDAIKNHAVFATVTKSESDAWIDSNVNNLEEAKTAMKHIMGFIIGMRNRDHPELENQI